ncbi:preprotein translocase subunit SecG [Sphingomonas colocasiae]|uniref:Protein-export membrane protein SecG n=1 Tax=Sphingomonas colocasiae TaxID=1848973 RepID=A0ABS7PNU6_9SPHN|nr:preprotein translocase subunit SecG [Sphingomonas colocasiae]
MFTFLLVLHAIIAAALVTVILMQRSEGGGLGMGGSPTGLMSARGAADFLTRATTILAGLFVAMCILLATLASMRSNGDVDTSLARQPAAPSGPTLPVDNAAVPAPAPTDPLADATSTPAPVANAAAPAAAAPRAERPAPRTTDPVSRSTPTPAAGNAAVPAPARVAPPAVVPVAPPAANGAAPSN